MIYAQVEAAAATVEEGVEVVNVKVDRNLLFGLFAGNFHLFVQNG